MRSGKQMVAKGKENNIVSNSSKVLFNGGENEYF